jgi:hypothetical protein
VVKSILNKPFNELEQVDDEIKYLDGILKDDFPELVSRNDFSLREIKIT